MNYSPLILTSLITSTLLTAGTIASKPIDPSLVVYNGNLGLVHENRKMQLDRGMQALIYKDVASSVVTDSVNVTFHKGVTLTHSSTDLIRSMRINSHCLILEKVSSSTSRPAAT